MTFEPAEEAKRNSAFATALREAITARGVTLAWLNQRLHAHGNPVSMATLSYWRSGARNPEGAQSLAAVADIEQLLNLEIGALTGLIRSSRRPGPYGKPRFPLRSDEIALAVEEAFVALGSTAMDPARDVSTHSVTMVGSDGHVVSRTTRSLVQCTSGTITRVPYVELTPELSTPAPIFRAIGGVRAVDHFSHPSGEVHGVAFALERPLGPAETAVIEWALEYPDGYPPTRETGHGVAHRCRELLLWTRFHPDALPDWIEEVDETPERVTVTPLSLEGSTSIHQVRRRFGPGMLSLKWGYGPRD